MLKHENNSQMSKHEFIITSFVRKVENKELENPIRSSSLLPRTCSDDSYASRTSKLLQGCSASRPRCPSIVN
ncbi:hypothetical protein HanRHA438_Chr16g0782271 [Helianthus annuus]|nr:hypothetical protein HanRHA438_Chr16g0782271 [Helianthus annuus]